MNRRRLIYFFSDYNYLPATLVVAAQIADALRHRNDFDVIVFVQSSNDDLSAIENFAKSRGVQVRAWSSQLAIADKLDFSAHVSAASLGRLVVASHVSSEYESVIYLDGDIQVCGNIERLLDAHPPAGRLLACVDSIAVCVNPEGAHGKSLCAYMGKLGVAKLTSYFNAGVLIADSATWCDIAKAAMQFIAEKPELCLYHDQSALNAVARDIWQPIHPRFNYGPTYEEIGAPFRPALYHYLGPRKPWAPSRPFGKKAATCYDDIGRSLPLLPPMIVSQDLGPLPSRYRPANAIRSLLRRRRLASYIRDTVFAFE